MYALIATLMLLLAVPSLAQQKTLAGKWQFTRLIIAGDTLFNRNDTFVYYRNYKAKKAYQDSPDSLYVHVWRIPPQPTDSSWYRKIYKSFSAYYVDFLADSKTIWGFPVNSDSGPIKGFYTIDWEDNTLRFYSDSLHKKNEAQFSVNIENATLQLASISPRGPIFWFTLSKQN